MLRLIHTQTVSGSILVDDIDDGLPNKTVHRLGANSDHHVLVTDGYASVPKQAVYIPRTLKSDPTLAGYIDIKVTARVSQSQSHGKIQKLTARGLLTPLTFYPGENGPPVVTSLVYSENDTLLTFTGFPLRGLAPQEAKLHFTGVGGPLTFYSSHEEEDGTVWRNDEIYFATTLVPGLEADNTFVQVESNGLFSAIIPIPTSI